MGPYGILPPDEAKAFFGVISEQQPVHGIELVVFLFPGLCAVAYALWRALRRGSVDFDAMAGVALFGRQPRQRVVWLYIAACGAVCLVLGAKFLLFVGFSNLLGAALLPVAMSEASSALAEQPARASLSRCAFMLLVLAVPLLAAMTKSAPAAPRPTAGGALVSYPSCNLRGIAPLLGPAAGKIVLAGPEDAPELLYRSKIMTVGSLYHHGVAGYLRDRAAWRAVPGGQVPPEVKATGAAYVLFCPAPGRYVLVQDLPRDTLWDALEAGAPPPWLHLAGVNSGGWRLYKITP
jgi:hypothetical protein